MKFIDYAEITIQAGNGGAGCVSFRREKFVPRGGPDGGDGGRGGDIIFTTHPQKSTLQDFRYLRTYEAKNGLPGAGANKFGKDGESKIIEVPVGTVLKNLETGEELFEFTEVEQTFTACHGGRGGKGNAHFATATFQAPKFSQPGEEGESLQVSLELKLLADVGIIGYPNAGKSTLISAISAAHPKVADYAFTTLTPVLGVVALPGFKSFVVADIPGLIEGASEGAGLGHRFLRHIEKTQVLIHMIDGASLLDKATEIDITGETDPHKIAREQVAKEALRLYQNIRNELGKYNEKLLHKPEIVAINKLDILESDPDLVQMIYEEVRKNLNHIRGREPLAHEPYFISGVAQKGIIELMEPVQDFVFKTGSQKDKEETVILPDGSSVKK
ncbi:MAG: GTPase ObgE [Bdellovibrionaceae bacterium]|nr:GTPase ObgE [Pseudobdellovibrionaceae bacterium]|tara:strand:- start:806 stop:1966 length:1161 start_codon:yes stop_codon:yes gene_type:complete